MHAGSKVYIGCSERRAWKQQTAWSLVCLSMLLVSACASDSKSPENLAQTPVVRDADAVAGGPVARLDAVRAQLFDGEKVATNEANPDDEVEDEKIEEAMVSVDNKVEEDDLPSGPVGDEISHATTQKIPMPINEDVQRWIEYFTVKDRERFQRFMERGEKFRGMIGAVLRDQGIPTELYYQAMIESGFATHATSHAQAVGIWQFIPGTGKRYGLRIDHYVDERRDPMRATIAAALYLKDLNNVFQSWYLAMAAYNAGETRIMNAIMRAKTRDFWEMVKIGALPAETMNYIPKFLAATMIGHDPLKYGFASLSGERMPTLASVSVPSPVRLTDIAATTGVPLATLQEYNPHLLRAMTPPGSTGHYRVWVAKEHVEKVEQHSEQLAALRIKGLSSQALASADSKPQFHRVKRGENLAKIAARYNVSLASLRKMNHLRSNSVRVGTQIRVVPKNDKGSDVATTTQRSGRAIASVDKDSAVDSSAVKYAVQYKVQRGDSLQDIAKRFNMSLQDLKKINRLKRNTIYSGQVLRLAAQERG